MAPTNKFLAQSNKSQAGGQSDQEAQKRYRQRGAIACTANGLGLPADFPYESLIVRR